MTHFSESQIIVTVARIVAPFIQLFGLSVLVHGHYGPGGGFQGGTMIAASFLLVRLAIGYEQSQAYFARSWGTSMGIVGALIFLAVGLIALGFGGRFLDYAFLPLGGSSPAELRYLGILLVEVGIGIAVATTLVAILDNLVGADQDD